MINNSCARVITLAKHLSINHVVVCDLEPLLALPGKIDSLIIDSEDGFSQLGQSRALLSRELGYPDTSLWNMVTGGPVELEPSIGSLADWNRFHNTDATLITLPSRIPEGRLKGAVLAPYDGSICHQRFANDRWSSTSRDFMYNVTYEGLHEAFYRLGARRVGLTHLSGIKTRLGSFDSHATSWQVEAVLHFSRAHPDLESVTFWDTTPGNPVQDSVDRLSSSTGPGEHRPIARSSNSRWGIEFVTLNWPKSVSGGAS